MTRRQNEAVKDAIERLLNDKETPEWAIDKEGLESALEEVNSQLSKLDAALEGIKDELGECA